MGTHLLESDNRPVSPSGEALLRAYFDYEVGFFARAAHEHLMNRLIGKPWDCLGGAMAVQ